MDLRDELEKERARRMRLEEELAQWQNSAIQKLKPDEIAETIMRQQVETLTFHLLKQRQMTDELNAQLRAKEKELALAVENIKSLEQELYAKEKEIGRARKVAPAEAEPAGKGPAPRPLPTDEELDSILQSASEPHDPAQAYKARREEKTIKDLVLIMRRMGRIKLFDAALLLDRNQEEVLRWALKLEHSGYLTFQGPQKTLIATEKLLEKR